MAQILHSLSYRVCSITLSNFNTFGLFIMILSTSAIMDQTACYYNVTTSETGLYIPSALVIKAQRLTLSIIRQSKLLSGSVI